MSNVFSSNFYSDFDEFSDVEFDDIDTVDSFDDKRKQKPIKLHSVNSLEYDNVTQESIDILESAEEHSNIADLFNVSGINSKKKKTQNDIDQMIVLAFYKNPTESNFKKVYDRFHYGVHAHACRIVGDWDLSADFVQETFERAWNRKNCYDPRKSSYSTWLYSICKNLCVSELRTRTKSKTLDVDVSEIFDSAVYGDSSERAIIQERYYLPGEDGQLEENSYEDVAKKMYDASIAELSNMDPLFMQIMTLKNLENMTLLDIAGRLGINESKVKNVYYKNKVILCDILKDKYADLYSTYRDAVHDKLESDPDVPVYKDVESVDADYICN